MLPMLGVILLGAIVGIAQVAAIRRLLRHRARESRGLALFLVGSGSVLLVGTFVLRWLTDTTINAWLAYAITLSASSAILIGVALLEAQKRRA